MEAWFILIVSICTAALLKSFFTLLFSTSTNTSSSTTTADGDDAKYNGVPKNKSQKLPPGPFSLPFLGSFLLLRKSFADLEPIIRDFTRKYGPVVTFKIGSRPAIFVNSHSLAYQALVQNGAFFSDRPRALPTAKVINSNQHNISSAPYGPNWRLFRRNLTSEILHPSRIRSYSHARRWVLDILVQSIAKSEQPLKVVDHFQYAMFCLLVLMCFGDKLDEKQIKEIERVQRSILLGFNRFNLLNFWPRLGKILFRNRWRELYQLRAEQKKVLIPLIKARIEKTKQQKEEEGDDHQHILAYVDTLIDLELPEEKRKLNDDEIVTLCGEFLSAGTDTTSTALQWIMACLVKYPLIQSKLYEEIVNVVGHPPALQECRENSTILKGVINEDDLQKMPYLKAVVLEGLRRHPPAHFVLPHSVSEDTELNGFWIPKNGSINFMVADMGWDPKVWKDPMEFKPERFLSDDGKKEVAFDLTCSKEIKMMPFGAGRRVCPGFGLAMLHLEYFVANLVWLFEWKAVDGDEVDLSEKQEFTMVMKNPLCAHVNPRVLQSV